MTQSPPWRLLLAGGMLLTSAVLLGLSLKLPLLYIRFDPQIPGWIPNVMGSHAQLKAWLVETTGVPTGPQYLPQLIRELYAHQEQGIAALLLVFSVMFPASKIALGTVLTVGFYRLPEPILARLVHGLELVGKWSMADVFVVGILIVYFNAEAAHFQYDAGVGLGAYAASAALSSLSAGLIRSQYAAQRQQRRQEMVAYLFGRGRMLRDAPGGDAIREAAVFLRDEPL